jgi:CHASE2 domain-containing sensor protein
MNLNEGLKRVSAVFFGLLGLGGTCFGMFALIVSPGEWIPAIATAVFSPIAAYFLHKAVCRVVSWVVEGFKSDVR